ncbi:hypothetical protein HWV62_39427 [Athelia sp. TMB]|nr:hypothetical protein HWV62_39427 [Athelia sp. TMB]
MRALIPGGESTVFNPPVGPSYDWTSVDVASGTSMMFVMVDANGNQGGSSDLEQVQANTDASCLNAQSPSSTASPTSTSTVPSAGNTSPSTSSSAPTATQTVAAEISIAAIAGTILGALVLLAVIITLGLFFLRKWRDENQSPYGGPGLTGAITGRRQSRRIASVDLSSVDSPNPMGPQYTQRSGLQAFAYPAPSIAATAPYTPPILLPQSGPHEPNPFVFPATPGYHTRQSSKTTAMGPVTPLSDSGSTQSGQQKAAIAGINGYKPTRFIVHTDVEEDPEVEEVLELPPQYTDRRPPPVDVKRRPSGSVQRQPSGSVQRQASTSMARQPSASARRQHSTSIRRRPPSGNVPYEDLPSLSPFAPSSPPSSGGQS